MRKSRIEILTKIASQDDGIRIDVTDSVFNKFFFKKWEFELENSGYGQLECEFWEDAISEVKKKFKDCVFLAEESYDFDGSFKKCGFDYVYEWLVMNEIQKNGYKTNIDIVRRVAADPSVTRYAHMTENHDEKRAIVTCMGDGRVEHCEAVIELTLPGIRFANQDQWLGFTSGVGVQLRRSVRESECGECVTFYRKLFNVLKMDVMKSGKYRVIEQSGFSQNSDVLAWMYELNGSMVAVFVNFTQERIDVDYLFVGVGKDVNVVDDLFGEKKIKLEKSNELELHLDKYSHLDKF